MCCCSLQSIFWKITPFVQNICSNAPLPSIIFLPYVYLLLACFCMWKMAQHNIRVGTPVKVSVLTLSASLKQRSFKCILLNVHKLKPDSILIVYFIIKVWNFLDILMFTDAAMSAMLFSIFENYFKTFVITHLKASVKNLFIDRNIVLESIPLSTKETAFNL